jgi:type IV secretory pathway protease TraF
MKRPGFYSRASLAAGGAAIAALGFAALSPNDVLLYNPSNSLQPGVYIRSGEPVVPGSVVTIAARDLGSTYVSERGFTDSGDRFLKRVAAMEGDTVCSQAGVIGINGKPVAETRAEDSSGAALPSWSGCVTISDTEVFLLGDTAESFDGRYWGVTSTADIEGVWRKFP